jgi:hypothetical protein
MIEEGCPPDRSYCFAGIDETDCPHVKECYPINSCSKCGLFNYACKCDVPDQSEKVTKQ